MSEKPHHSQEPNSGPTPALRPHARIPTERFPLWLVASFAVGTVFGVALSAFMMGRVPTQILSVPAPAAPPPGAWQAAPAPAPPPSCMRGKLGAKSFYMHKKAQKPRLGVRIAPHGEGLLVDQVVRSSPAARGGFAAGDVIILFEGQNYREAQGFVDAIQAQPKGAEVNFEVKRGNKTVLLKAALAD